jgi:hypothetical protein
MISVFVFLILPTRHEKYFSCRLYLYVHSAACLLTDVRLKSHPFPHSWFLSCLFRTVIVQAVFGDANLTLVEFNYIQSHDESLNSAFKFLRVFVFIKKYT